MGVSATSSWYAQNTNKYVIEDMIDWNFGIDANAPLITWDEDPESRMDASDLVSLVDAGAIVVDAELRTWISDRWGVSDPGPNTPVPPGPSTSITAVPQPLLGEKIPTIPFSGAAAARARRAEERRRERWDAQHLA
jgi:hypothetical protein